MRRSATTLFAMGLALALAPAAHAAFGLSRFDVAFSNRDGSPVTQVGAHPFSMRTSFHLNEEPDPVHPGSFVLAGEIKDLITHLPAGLSLDQGAMPTCPTADFLQIDPVTGAPECPDATAVGIARLDVFNSGGGLSAALFNLPPPPGVLAKFGLVAFIIPVTVEVVVDPNRPYGVLLRITNALQGSVSGFGLTLWGDPASAAHDAERGACILHPGSECPVGAPEAPLLTMPTNCSGPLVASYRADSWQKPGAWLPSGEADLSDPAWVTGSIETHYPGEPPIPLALSGCASLPFKPTISAKPTTLAATSPTGLDFSVDVHDEGIGAATGLANSQIRKAEVTLPEGFSINPSLAEGLSVCTETELGRESSLSVPGAGCPNASKIGTVEAESPVWRAGLRGALFIAKPYENPLGSLLALYVVIKNTQLGIDVVQPLRVEPDPVTGRLTAIAEDLPELAFSHFKLHFREGTRSPLVSPSACATYRVEAVLTPYSGMAPITTTSAFQITSGPEGNACPQGGLPPFKPGLVAGSINNAAGRFSPFNVRLSRNDSEQEITHFSIKLPPGVIGKLAGIPICPNAAIAAAKSRSGPYGAQEELERPSCPAASQVGRTLAGFGVGASPAYAPGRLYLAGPYRGSALSLVSVTSARVGPFDLGAVVVREALKIDPETAEVFIDATGSDPIPHIVKGIPAYLRDIRAYVDRPNFTLNPTGCERTSTASTLLGSGLDFSSEADDRPVTVSTPFQASDCAALGFEPKLSLRLKGGTKRGDHPALSATLRMKGSGESNVKSAQVTLPRSEFLENAHIKTICTRAQFRARACPAASIYGFARAVTPILDKPLTGPVFLRSSEHQFPDLVAELKNGEIEIDLAGRIDSVGGRIRATFAAAPDAPLESFTLAMQGAGKGLLVNSTNLCKGPHRAVVSFAAHNGKQVATKPMLRPRCGRGRGSEKPR